MRKIVYSLFAFTVVLFASGFRQDEWKEFRYEADGFLIALPSSPSLQEVAQETALGKAITKLFTLIRIDGGFLFSVSDISALFKTEEGVQDTLNGFREAILKSSKGKLVSEKGLSLGEYAGREFLVELRPDLFSKVRVFLVKKRIYSLTFIAKRENLESEDGAKFFASFHLLENPTATVAEKPLPNAANKASDSAVGGIPGGIPDNSSSPRPVDSPFIYYYPSREIGPDGQRLYFVSKEERLNFIIDFPNKPTEWLQLNRKPAGREKVYVFSLTNEDKTNFTAMSVQRVAPPSNIDDTKQLFNEERDKLIKEQKAKLTKESDITLYNAYPGREFLAETDEGTLHGRLYHIDAQSYLLTAFIPKAKSEADALKFFASLKVATPLTPKSEFAPPPPPPMLIAPSTKGDPCAESKKDSSGGVLAGATSGQGIDMRSEQVIRGYAITIGRPTYPLIAKQAGIMGRVEVAVTIDEEGNVISAIVVTGHPFLRGNAVAAAKASKFRPTLLCNKPIKVQGLLTYNFLLD